MIPILKTFVSNFISGAIRDKLTTGSAVAVASAAATIPALGGESSFTLSSDPSIAAAQLIAAVTSLILIYIDRNRAKK